MSETLMIVEDDPHVSHSLGTSLSAHGYHVIECATGGEALKRARETPPDLLLLDLNLPDVDGMTVVESIRDWSTVPIIVVSARIHEKEKVQALDAGADDYLTKPFGIEELLARIRNALRHTLRSRTTPATFRSGPLFVDLANQRVEVEGKEVRLTSIELKLLAALISNADKVMTHRQLLQRVWGPDFGDQVQYLRVYMGHLRRKLEKDPLRPRLFSTEAGIGYRLRLVDP